MLAAGKQGGICVVQNKQIRSETANKQGRKEFNGRSQKPIPYPNSQKPIPASLPDPQLHLQLLLRHFLFKNKTLGTFQGGPGKSSQPVRWLLYIYRLLMRWFIKIRPKTQGAIESKYHGIMKHPAEPRNIRCKRKRGKGKKNMLISLRKNLYHCSMKN